MYRNLVNRLSLFRLNFLEILSYSMINSKSLANKVVFHFVCEQQVLVMQSWQKMQQILIRERKISNEISKHLCFIANVTFEIEI